MIQIHDQNQVLSKNNKSNKSKLLKLIGSSQLYSLCESKTTSLGIFQMDELQDFEKSPQIVIFSPEQGKEGQGEDEVQGKLDYFNKDELTKLDPEASGRLSILSGESVGNRSLMSRVSELSFNFRIYKYENVFLVIVFVLIAFVFVLFGILFAKIFLCDLCDKKKDVFENVTTLEDLDEYQHHSYN